MELYDRSAVLSTWNEKDVRDRLHRLSLWGNHGIYVPEPERFMITIPVPLRDRATGVLVDVFYCRACRDVSLLDHNRKRAFTKDGMFCHIQRYGSVYRHSSGAYEHRPPDGARLEAWLAMQRGFGYTVDDNQSPATSA